MEPIGKDHGITAFVNWLQGQPNMPTRNPNYDPKNPYTWPWPEKLERTLDLMRQQYENEAKGTTGTKYVPPANP
jgi:hypothetical protein